LEVVAAERIAAGQAQLELGLAAAAASGPLQIVGSKAGHLWDALCRALRLARVRSGRWREREIPCVQGVKAAAFGASACGLEGGGGLVVVLSGLQAVVSQLVVCIGPVPSHSWGADTTTGSMGGLRYL
jgi:hypothetical protein